MKITSSVEYAARLMVSLARRFGQESTSISAEKLSESENIPVDYVNQLLLKLKRAGLVESHRGATGGYLLSRQPSAINLGQVVRAVEGQVFEDVCARFDGGARDCRHQGGCGITPVWQKLGTLIEEYLESVTLASMLAGAKPGCLSSPDKNPGAAVLETPRASRP